MVTNTEHSDASVFSHTNSPTIPLHQYQFSFCPLDTNSSAVHHQSSSSVYAGISYVLLHHISSLFFIPDVSVCLCPKKSTYCLNQFAGQVQTMAHMYVVHSQHLSCSFHWCSCFNVHNTTCGTVSLHTTQHTTAGQKYHVPPRTVRITSCHHAVAASHNTACRHDVSANHILQPTCFS